MSYTKGILVTILGAVCWGLSGTCTQYLCAQEGLDSAWLTQIRLLSAGVILICFALLKERNRVAAFWKTPASVLHCVVFGVGGLMFTQYTYATAISKTNSGTATVLQYCSVVFVLLISCIMAKKWPVPREWIGIACSVLGMFLVATHGSLTSLYISKEGLFWGLLSAVAATCYIMIPQKLMREWGSILPIGWGMLFGGIAFFFLLQVWRIPLVLSPKILVGLIVIVFVGTVCAFVFFLTGTSMIGAARGNMIGCVEPLVATVTTAVVLHTVFLPMDLLGFVFVLATVFVLAKK